MLPDTLVEIGESAFEGCSGLTKLYLPDTLTQLEYKSFFLCSGITEIILPNNLTEIENSAFSYCSGLTKLILPNTLTEIRECAFESCSGLTEVKLPDTLTTIGEGAFAGCSGFTDLRLPGSIQSIGSYAFSRCTNLQLVTMHSTVQFECNSDDVSQLFNGCPSLKAVSAPQEVVSRFPPDMFEGCGTAPSALLRAATAELQMWYYWSRERHLKCSPAAKNAVLTVMLVGLRLQMDDHNLLPPPEIWCYILEFILRHELGKYPVEIN